jgi:hypothetical protein
VSGYLMQVNAVKAKVIQGEKLMLAGDESVLSQIPAGNWIGGSIPYFIAEEGGLSSRDKIFVTEISKAAASVSIVAYDETSLPKVYSDAPDNGFSLIILPAASSAELAFGLKAPTYPNFARRPLVGWIAGVHLDDLGKATPKVFNGLTGTMMTNGAVVMHVTLPATQAAEVGIVNLFEQGNGDTITFPSDGFGASKVFINGVETNFAEYVAAKKVDIRFPLVSDYYGASVNVSFQNLDPVSKRVEFYAPVFAGVQYKLAKPVDDYVKQFSSNIPTGSEQIAFSCNCILNYLYSGLEGKRTGGITGPVTFGEVAYQLLNQTMVYVTVHDVVKA